MNQIDTIFLFVNNNNVKQKFIYKKKEKKTFIAILFVNFNNKILLI